MKILRPSIFLWVTMHCLSCWRRCKKAEKYIFLEYFIISPGVMWESMLEVLKEKAAAGLDVRVMYDDFGCITQLPAGYRKKLESWGIRCCVFEPFIPIMSARLNNRDHRKLLIIDGKVGFTGGINLADEYINQKLRFGHWKDNAILLRGDAVWSMTVMFLSLWDYVAGSRRHASPTISRRNRKPPDGALYSLTRTILWMMNPWAARCIRTSSTGPIIRCIL